MASRPKFGTRKQMQQEALLERPAKTVARDKIKETAAYEESQQPGGYCSKSEGSSVSSLDSQSLAEIPPDPPKIDRQKIQKAGDCYWLECRAHEEARETGVKMKGSVFKKTLRSGREISEPDDKPKDPQWCQERDAFHAEIREEKFFKRNLARGKRKRLESSPEADPLADTQLMVDEPLADTQLMVDEPLTCEMLYAAPRPEVQPTKKTEKAEARLGLRMTSVSFVVLPFDDPDYVEAVLAEYEGERDGWVFLESHVPHVPLYLTRDEIPESPRSRDSQDSQ